MSSHKDGAQGPRGVLESEEGSILVPPQNVNVETWIPHCDEIWRGRVTGK